MSTASLSAFISELKSCQSIVLLSEKLNAVTALLQCYERDFIDWVDIKQLDSPYNQCLLADVIFENADHSLCVMATSWLPGCGAPPHNHGTWAVLTSIIGEEKNTLWQTDAPLSEQTVELKQISEFVCKPGAYFTLQSSDIHSVYNHTKQLSVSLQVYGINPNNTSRVQVEPDTGIVKPFHCPVCE